MQGCENLSRNFKKEVMRLASKEGRIKMNGGQIWYQIFGAEQSKAPLLCLHGGPGMTHDYLLPLRDLADERPVIFYDQLGSGKSDRSDDLELWRVERFVDEVQTVIRELQLNEFHLFGNSWGGWLAMQSVLDLSLPQLLSLTVSSAPSSVAKWIETSHQLKTELPAKVQADIENCERKGDFESDTFQEAMMIFYQKHLCRLKPWPEELTRTFEGMGANVYHEMWGPSEFGPVIGNLKSWDITDRLEELTVPSLVTVGKYDEAGVKNMKELHAHIRNSRFHLFEQSSHTAFLEEREAYMSVLRDFLRDHD